MNVYYNVISIIIRETYNMTSKSWASFWRNLSFDERQALIELIPYTKNTSMRANPYHGAYKKWDDLPKKSREQIIEFIGE